MPVSDDILELPKDLVTEETGPSPNFNIIVIIHIDFNIISFLCSHDSNGRIIVWADGAATDQQHPTIRRAGYGVWFAQINCPLYYDSCTWYVPESVYRRNNTEVEKDLVAFSEDSLEQKPGESAIAAERRLLRYCRAMPDAVQVHLAPGDFFIYRHCGLHLGNYSPDVKRVTIHDNAMNQEVHDFWRTSNRREEQRGRNAESYAASP